MRLCKNGWCDWQWVYDLETVRTIYLHCPPENHFFSPPLIAHSVTDLVLATYIFSPAALSRKGADDEALNGTSLPYRGEREDDDDRQAGNRFSMWICYTKGKETAVLEKGGRIRCRRCYYYYYQYYYDDDDR